MAHSLIPVAPLSSFFSVTAPELFSGAFCVVGGGVSAHVGNKGHAVPVDPTGKFVKTTSVAGPPAKHDEDAPGYSLLLLGWEGIAKLGIACEALVGKSR